MGEASDPLTNVLITHDKALRNVALRKSTYYVEESYLSCSGHESCGTRSTVCVLRLLLYHMYIVS